MRTFFLVVLPLAAMVLVTGCEEGYQASGYSPPAARSAPAPAAASQAAAPAPAPTPAPQQQQYRSSTTQPLPSGWGYMHEQDLAGGKISPDSTANTDS